MELEERLRTQWTEAVQDWIETDQSIRIGYCSTRGCWRRLETCRASQ